ncbi:MAG: biotin-dependent carboxyltransferase family protein [Cyclobacteriaceae bacterium]
MAEIIFKKAGIWTSLQDGGRFNQAKMGIPVSGPMDSISFQLTNHLIRHDPLDSCLEIYMGGLELMFTESCQVVCYGALSKISIGLTQYAQGRIFTVKKGEILTISNFEKGQWLYLSLHGRLETEELLGSRSFYIPVTKKEKFQDGEKLTFIPNERLLPTSYARIGRPMHLSEKIVEVYPGPDFSLLTKTQRVMLFSKPFSLSQSQNRMGIHLVETLTNQMEELLSAPIYPGTVQLTPSGKIIVMMKDAQVTGGYPRILQLSEKAIGILAQKRPFERIYFQLIFF